MTQKGSSSASQLNFISGFDSFQLRSTSSSSVGFVSQGLLQLAQADEVLALQVLHELVPGIEALRRLSK